jgi:hypothetical protein
MKTHIAALHAYRRPIAASGPIFSKTRLVRILRAAVPLMLLLGISSPADSETVMIKRRLVRFDGKPAAGAKVQVLSERGYTKTRTNFEVTADANGVFSADVPQTDSQWIGYTIVRAEGCAVATEVGITGLPKSDPRMLELQMDRCHKLPFSASRF